MAEPGARSIAEAIAAFRAARAREPGLAPREFLRRQGWSEELLPHLERAAKEGAPDATVGVEPPTAGAPAAETAAETIAVEHEPGGATFDRRYRIVRELGAGGFGKVYLVQDTLNANEELALKLIRSDRLETPEITKRFRNEIRTMRALAHPGIPQIYNDGLTEAGEFYYTMAYVRGRSLADVIRGEAPLAPDRVVRLVKQMLDVLDYAHRRGVVHRDLKPGNVILVDPGGEQERAKVLDFGIAKLLQREGELEHALTMNTEAAIGTPHYMAPEQVRGKEVDGRTDLYALGIIVYQMCTGKMPFSGTTVMEILSARLEQEPTPLVKGQVPEWLESLVMRLLEREREKRPTAETVLVQLEEMARGQRAIGKQLRWVAGGVLVLALAIAWLIYARKEERPPVHPNLAEASKRPSEPPGEPTVGGPPPEEPPSEVARAPGRVEETSQDPRDGAAEAQQLDGGQLSPGGDPATSKPIDEGPPAPVRTQEGSSGAPEQESGAAPAPAAPAPPTVLLPAGFTALAGAALDPSGRPHAIRDERTGLELVLVPGEGALSPFYVGRTEVSWATFERVLGRDPAQRHDFDQPGFDKGALAQHPVVKVSGAEAEAFCRAAGFVLPTRAQWVRAAGGPDRDFPSGVGPARGACNLDGTVGSDRYALTAPCGALADDVSPCGALDLGGNVREFCRDGEGLTVCGGSWGSDEAAARIDFTPRRVPMGGDDRTGFRVVLEL